MAKSGHLSVRFWGVRGSIACPGPDTVRYGGNTSCVEIRCGEHLLIMDGGTGLRELGSALLKNGTMMMAPLFPVPMSLLNTQVSFKDFRHGETLKPRPGVTLRTGPLNHPNGATGYRVEYAGKSVAYITDTEHKKGALDPNVLALIEGVDIFIYDSTYTEAEYPTHVDWGHSTWEQGVRLADAAKVKTFVVFHHDPSHDDAFMDRVGSAAQALRPSTIVAREGMVLLP